MNLIYDDKSFLLSAICSDNVYIESGHTRTFKKMFGQETMPLIRHIKCYDNYLLCPSTFLKKDRSSFYLNAISKPMLKGFVWPIDMLLSGDLVFNQKIGSENTYHNIWEYTKDNHNGFEDERIKFVILSFLQCLQNFYDNGYVYRYWDERNIFFGEKTNEVIFQFNNYISNKNNVIELKKDQYYTELTDPFIYYNECVYDFYSDMYSFQSLLFKLLIGIYPFEGEELTGYERNGTMTDLNGWIMEYLRNVYFIFDDESNRNHIGIMGADIPRVKRWESLTPNLKNMFKQVFSRSNVLRENDSIVYYSPKEWLNELEDFDYSLK